VIKKVHETVMWQFLNSTVHAKTLIMMWTVMIIVFIFCYLGVRNLTSGKPGKLQNVLEWIVDFVNGIINDNLTREQGRPLLNYLLTLIVFIFFSNMIGLFPNITFNLFEHANIETAHLNHIFAGPMLMSPTADVNVTMGLALMTITMVVFLGVKYKGKHYFGHFFQPFKVFFIIHLIDLISKPLTLAFRLFGNIFAGEVMIAVILMLPGIWVLPGVLPLVVWMAFSVFIGTIQAYVFTVLTTAYISQAVTPDD
jgi:F-type H+-transporting ATPase subunit a